MKHFRFFSLALALVTLSLNASSPDQSAILAKAKRTEKGGWIYIHTEGNPHDRGFQHGYLLAHEIGECVRNSRVSWQYKSAMQWDWLTQKAAELFTAKI